MKAAVNNITESAKRRDTVGRNRVSVIKDTQTFGVRLFDYQNTYSSDNVEKLTTLILRDELSNITFVLKYRIQIVVGDSTDLDDANKQLSLQSYLDFIKSQKTKPTHSNDEEGGTK